MAENAISPGFIKMFYNVGSHPHHAIFPVKWVGTPEPGDEPDIEANDGTPLTMSVAIAALTLKIKPFYLATDSINQFEAWYKPNAESNPIWIYVVAPPSPSIGTGTGSTVLAGQNVLTYRTTQGGVYKLYLMESRIAANTRDPYPYPAGPNKDISDYLLGATGWVRGRDDGKLITGIYNTTKINDALRKKYVLNA